MARMGLAGAVGRWWGLALGLATFFPGKAIASASHPPISSTQPESPRDWELDDGHDWVVGGERSQKSWVTLGWGEQEVAPWRKGLRSRTACPAGKQSDARLYVARKHFLRLVLHKNNNM